MPWTNLSPEFEINFLQLSYQLVNKVIKVTLLQEISDNKLDDIHQNSLKASISVYFFTQNQSSDIINEPP